MEHKVYMNYIHPSSLLRQLSDLWKANKMCDAVITVGNVHVAKAHKVVLIAASPKLKSFDLKSSSILKVSLPSGISHQTVHIFLRYIYEGYLILTPKSAEDLLKIATFLNIICLANCCKDVLNSFESNTIVLPEKNIENRDVEFYHFRKSEVEKFVEGQNDCDNWEITDPKTKQQMTDDGMSHKNRQSRIPSQSSHSPPSDCSARTPETENIARHLLDTLDQSSSGGSQIEIEQEDDIPGVEILDVTGSTLKQPRQVSEACPKTKKRKLSSTVMNPKLQCLTSKNSQSSSVLPPSENRSTLLPIQLVRSSTSDIGEGIQQGTDQQHLLFFVQNTQSGEIVMNDKAETKSTVQPSLEHLEETQIKIEPLCDFSVATDNNDANDIQIAATSSSVPGDSTSSVPPRELSLGAIKTEPEDELDQTLTSASDGEQGDYDGQTMWFSGDSVQHAGPSQGMAASTVAHGSFQQRLMTPFSSLTQMRAQQSIKRSIQSSVSAARRARSLSSISESVSSPRDQGDQSFSSDGREDLSNEKMETEALDGSFLDVSLKIGVDGTSIEDSTVLSSAAASVEEINRPNQNVSLPPTKRTAKVLKCNECGKSYTRKGSLKRHVQSHSNSIKCNECHVYYENEADYLSHKAKVHKAKHLCSHCGKTFERKWCLTSHLRKHIADSRFVCPFERCQNHFANRDSYQAHINTHKNVKPHECEKCSKTFVSKRYKAIHTKKCIDGLPMTCDVCQRSFSGASALRVHRQGEHEQKAYKCGCGKIYKYQTGLLNHKTESGH